MISRKARLRRELRARRAAIPPAIRRQAAVRAARIAARLLRGRRLVAVYLAQGSELDTAPLIRSLARQHRLYLPRLHDERMTFVGYRPGAAMRRNRFDIPEPIAARRAARLDAIVMPLLGFDAKGSRLGQGGGFYDRALLKRGGLRIGFAFALQEVSTIPVEPHDVRLDAVATEHGLRRFR